MSTALPPRTQDNKRRDQIIGRIADEVGFPCKRLQYRGWQAELLKITTEEELREVLAEAVAVLAK